MPNGERYYEDINHTKETKNCLFERHVTSEVATVEEGECKRECIPNGGNEGRDGHHQHLIIEVTAHLHCAALKFKRKTISISVVRF